MITDGHHSRCTSNSVSRWTNQIGVSTYNGGHWSGKIQVFCNLLCLGCFIYKRIHSNFFHFFLSSSFEETGFVQFESTNFYLFWQCKISNNNCNFVSLVFSTRVLFCTDTHYQGTPRLNPRPWICLGSGTEPT